MSYLLRSMLPHSPTKVTIKNFFEQLLSWLFFTITQCLLQPVDILAI